MDFKKNSLSELFYDWPVVCNPISIVFRLPPIQSPTSASISDETTQTLPETSPPAVTDPQMPNVPSAAAEVVAEPAAIVAVVVPPVAAAPPPPKPAPKPPVRSIFDLDYSDDDDPIHDYKALAAAAAAQRYDTATTTTDDAVIVAAEPAAAPVVAVVEMMDDDDGDDDEDTSMSSASRPTNSNQPAAAAEALTLSIPAPIVPAAPPAPRFVVHEDPQCAARRHFVDNKNRVTAFHVRRLHNLYVAGVNGNWDDRPQPGPFDHHDADATTETKATTAAISGEGARNALDGTQLAKVAGNGIDGNVHGMWCGLFETVVS